MLALIEDTDEQAAVIIDAPPDRPFVGRAVWDAMLSLGLRWGDADLFHWGEWFSVWTSTPPGYFLPEAIAADQLVVSDLCFGFSVPRSPAPLHVLDAMAAGANWAATRLGGHLSESNGAPFDLAAARAAVARTVARLAQSGFAPGSAALLRLF